MSRTLDVRPGADLADALLEVRTASHPVAHIPLAALEREVRIPAGRSYEVRVRDNDAQRLPGSRVRAHYIPDLLGPPELHPAEPLEVDDRGRHRRSPAGGVAGESPRRGRGERARVRSASVRRTSRAARSASIRASR